MANQDEKASFACHWKIENVSVLMSEKNSTVHSPVFKTDASSYNEEFIMHLRVRDYLNNVVIRITKCKTGKHKGKKDKVSLPNCQLLVFKDDGSTLGNFKSKVQQLSQCRTCIEFFIPHEIFDNSNKVYLPHDTLTLCCKMDISNYYQCYFRTVLYLRTLFWKIDFSKESHIITKTLELDSNKLTINLIKGSSKNESLRIEILETNEVTIKFVNCKITLMDTNNAVFSSITGDNCINIPVYSYPLINDSITLHCKLIVELREISYEGYKSPICCSSEDIFSEVSNAVSNKKANHAVELKTLAESPLCSSNTELKQLKNQPTNNESKSNPLTLAYQIHCKAGFCACSRMANSAMRP